MSEPAPLVGTASSPVPDGGSASWFAGAGGARLRAALFPSAVSTPRGSVVVHPGRTEPIEKYFEVVERLRARGFTVLVHDWRGQGLSHRMLPDRAPGHAAGWADFVEDHGLLLDRFGGELPEPWISLGHSMGGCLALLALAEGENRYAGAILSAPMLGVQLGRTAPFAARAMARTQRFLGRAGTLARPDGPPETFETNILTHDRERWSRNQALVAAQSDLALGGPTWGWIDFALTATARLQQGAGVTRIGVPVTIVAAGEERLVDNAALRRVAERTPGACFVEIPGAYHEILQETDALQAPFWAAFDDLAADVAAGA